MRQESILLDTSVWVEFFRGKNEKLGVRVQELLDADSVILGAPVLIEILSGSSRATYSTLRRVLSALPLYYPQPSTWHRMEDWIALAILKGERFGVGDLLIASIAADRQVLLWSLDSDFKRMEKLGWLKLLT